MILNGGAGSNARQPDGISICSRQTRATHYCKGIEGRGGVFGSVSFLRLVFK